MTDVISEDVEYLMIVRRGEAGIFRSLKARLEAPGQLQVFWDRRVAERRTQAEATPSERRQQDRRQTNLIGNLVAFLVAEPGDSSERPAA
jgi:uncharacterized protein (DUF58 family)